MLSRSQLYYLGRRVETTILKWKMCLPYQSGTWRGFLDRMSCVLTYNDRDERWKQSLPGQICPLQLVSSPFLRPGLVVIVRLQGFLSTLPFLSMDTSQTLSRRLAFCNRQRILTFHISSVRRQLTMPFLPCPVQWQPSLSYCLFSSFRSLFLFVLHGIGSKVSGVYLTTLNPCGA